MHRQKKGRRLLRSNLRSGLLLVYITLALGFFSLAFAMSAAGAVFNPAGHEIEMAATNPEFTFGEAAIVCPGLKTSGTLTEPASAVVPLGIPEFSGECASSGLEGLTFKATAGTEPSKPWALEAKSASSVNLNLPLGKSPFPQPVYFKSGTCEVFVKILPVTGSWSNGFDWSPLAEPSTLTFSKASSAGNFNANCPPSVEKALKASEFRIFWTSVFTVKDLTVASKAVTLK